MPRDNLLNSACLELFEFIKRENIKPLIAHLVENYRDKLEQITYVDTFQNLILKYEQQKHSVEVGPGPDFNQSYSSVDTEPATVTPHHGMVNGGRWQGLKDADAEEEAYFNGEDEDQEALAVNKEEVAKPTVNGANPLSKPLVDYPLDDEEDAMDILATDAVPGKNTAPHAENGDMAGKHVDDPEDQALDEQQKQAPTPPPERIAEKRRREEDDEDELGKLSITGGSNKRRSSSSASSDVSVPTQSGNAPQSMHFLRRKKSNLSNKDAAGPRKISISLAVKGGAATDKSENAS